MKSIALLVRVIHICPYVPPIPGHVFFSRVRIIDKQHMKYYFESRTKSKINGEKIFKKYHLSIEILIFKVFPYISIGHIGYFYKKPLEVF